MYRHENDRIYKQLENGEERFSPKPSRQKQLFAQCMNACIKRAYGGKIPSYAVIARDFSLRYPEDGSISSESIRKWMTGRALPQSHRLSALIDWLGADIATALSLHAELLNIKENDRPGDPSHTSSLSSRRKPLSSSDDQIFNLIQNLSFRDRKIILSILRILQSNGNT